MNPEDFEPRMDADAHGLETETGKATGKTKASPRIRVHPSPSVVNSSDSFFHGKTGGRLVVVGPINLPVGRLFIEGVITECRKRGASRVDVLAFEFEMGLFPAVLDEAEQKGIDLAPKTIPPEVLDKRAVDKGQVRFHHVAYIEVTPRYGRAALPRGQNDQATGGKNAAQQRRPTGDDLTLAVELTDFSVYYLQGISESITVELKAGRARSCAKLANSWVLEDSRQVQRARVVWWCFMHSKATTVRQYLAELPAERRTVIEAVRALILDNLDAGFEEGMQYGMIGCYVPQRIYPAGYHCDPRQPLPFICLASQKNYMSLYLGCVYGPDRETPFREAWAKTGKRLDMGTSCVRFRKLNDLALEVIARSIRRCSARGFIKYYERVLKTSLHRSRQRPRAKQSRPGLPRANSVRGDD
jgi:hypothetical protein